jgi:endonuclease/exonuclease/phosphatase family metal-dependent hydrolase
MRDEARPARMDSYNVHGCIGLYGRQSAARVARVLSAIGADVVGLQEVAVGVERPADGIAQAAWLARRLEMTLVDGRTMDRRGGSFGNALLSRLPVVRSRVHALPRSSGEPRNAIEAVLEARDGALLRVLSTHLSVRPAERHRQARALAELCRDHNGELVLMGDLNGVRESGSLGPLFDLLGPSTRIATFPARFPLMALDRMWLRSASRRLRARVHASAEARIASDHLPLVGELTRVQPVAPSRT